MWKGDLGNVENEGGIISGNTVQGNGTGNGGGGGIFIQGMDAVFCRIENCTISDNSSELNGGDLWLSGSATLTSCKTYGNT